MTEVLGDAVVVLRAADRERDCPVLPLVEGGGEARAIVWPGMGARHRSMQVVDLATGARTVPLRHPGEAVWYVVRGSGVVAEDGGGRHEIVTGSMVHVEPGDGYRFTAGDEGLRLAGGPCPPDPALYDHLTGG
jgi:quercetin dioxygenase-like cupin family protein